MGAESKETSTAPLAPPRAEIPSGYWVNSIAYIGHIPPSADKEGPSRISFSAGWRILSIMSLRCLLLLPFVLGACYKDETVAGYGGADQVWTLIEMGGAPFTARATLVFPEPGRLSGQGPCNSYGGEQTAPYPWFDAKAIFSTRMACQNLREEAAYFSALEHMTLAEIQGSTMILSDDSGKEMVFTANEPE